MTKDTQAFYINEDELNEDELDELYRPRKMNNRKSLAPLFIYEILKSASSPRRHLTQSELIERLLAYPYELAMERKAVGRTLHLLADAGIGVCSTRRGAWYDEESWH